MEYERPLDNPEIMAEALKELDFGPQEASELGSFMLRLNRLPDIQPSPAVTEALLQRLESLLPQASPIRIALHEQQARPQNKLMVFLRIARTQVSILRFSFWLISFLLVILGTVIILLGQNDLGTGMLLRLLGPALAYLGTASAFRSIGYHINEIELACPPSPLQLTLARLVVVLGYDIVLGLGMSGLLAFWSGDNFLALTLHWLTPLLLVTGLTLALTLYTSPGLSVSLAYSGWSGLVLADWLREEFGFSRSIFSSNSELLLGFLGLALLGIALTHTNRISAKLLPRL